MLIGINCDGAEDTHEPFAVLGFAVAHPIPINVCTWLPTRLVQSEVFITPEASCTLLSKTSPGTEYPGGQQSSNIELRRWSGITAKDSKKVEHLGRNDERISGRQDKTLSQKYFRRRPSRMWVNWCGTSCGQLTHRGKRFDSHCISLHMQRERRMYGGNTERIGSL